MSAPRATPKAENPPAQNHHGSFFLKFPAAGTAGMVAYTMIHPINTTRIRAMDSNRPFMTVGREYLAQVRTEGFSRVSNGWSAGVIDAFMHRAVKFGIAKGVSDKLKEAYFPGNDFLSSLKLGVATAGSVVVPEMVVLKPFDVMRQLLQRQASQAGTGLIAQFQLLIKEGNIFSRLYAGGPALGLRSLTFSVPQFSATFVAKEKLKETGLPAQDFISGMIGGVAGSFTSMPADNVNTALSLHKGKPGYENMPAAIKTLYNEGGLERFFRAAFAKSIEKGFGIGVVWYLLPHFEKALESFIHSQPKPPAGKASISGFFSATKPAANLPAPPKPALKAPETDPDPDQSPKPKR